MPSPFVYFAGTRLSQAELTAACLDGHLVALGEGYVPADLVETAPLRAASLAQLLGDALAASHLSAAWVHGAIDDPPPRHCAQRAVPRRLHHIIDRRVIYRDPFIPPPDLVRLSGVFVTTPARTAADLARTPDAEYTRALRSWSQRDPHVLADARVWLAAHPQLPHRRRADVVLAELTRSGRQDEVTRYTS